MKVSLPHLEQGFINWYTKEIVPMSFKLVLTLPFLTIFVNNMKTKYATIINLLLDENNMIDVEELHKQYAEILNAKGNITIAGIKFTTEDLDKLLAYIKNTVAADVNVAPAVL